MNLFQVEANYLAKADRHTNWLSVFHLNKNDYTNIIMVLRQYFAKANKRTELAVKAAQRFITGNLGPQGTLDTNRFAQTVLEHRTTPGPLHGLNRHHLWQRAQKLHPS